MIGMSLSTTPNTGARIRAVGRPTYYASNYGEDFNAAFTAASRTPDAVLFLTAGHTYAVTPTFASDVHGLSIIGGDPTFPARLHFPDTPDSGLKLINSVDFTMSCVECFGSDTIDACVYGIIMDGALGKVLFEHCAFHGFGGYAFRSKKYDGGFLRFSGCEFYNIGNDRHGGTTFGHGVFPGRVKQVLIEYCHFHDISPQQPDAKAHGVYLTDANESGSNQCEVAHSVFERIGGAVASYKLVRGRDIIGVFRNNTVRDTPRGVVFTDVARAIAEQNEFVLSESSSGYGVNLTNVDSCRVVNNGVTGTGYTLAHGNGVVIYDEVLGGRIAGNKGTNIRHFLFITNTARGLLIGGDNQADSFTFTQVEGNGYLEDSDIINNQFTSKGGNGVYFAGTSEHTSASRVVVRNNRQLPHQDENNPAGSMVKARYIDECFIDANITATAEPYNLQNIGTTYVGTLYQVGNSA